MCNLCYSECALSRCTKTNLLLQGDILQQAQSFKQVFHKSLASQSHILVQFYLKALSENRSQRSLILKSAPQGALRVHSQGALKHRPSEPGDMFYQNQNLQDYHRSLSLLCYMFYFTIFIKNVFQNSWRNTTPINTVLLLTLKLIF